MNFKSIINSINIFDPQLGGKVRVALLAFYGAFISLGDQFNWEKFSWYGRVGTVGAVVLVVLGAITHFSTFGNAPNVKEDLDKALNDPFGYIEDQDDE